MVQDIPKTKYGASEFVHAQERKAAAYDAIKKAQVLIGAAKALLEDA